jgi:hypothetical protein
MTIRLIGAVVVVAGLLGAPLAEAQTRTQIYKWTGADGVTSYSQAPPPSGSGRNVQTITVESLPAEQQQAARRMLAHLESNANDQAAAIRNRFTQADQNVGKALEALQRAESALSTGSQPTGSDFIGNRGGGTRLRESYFQRVAQLEADVQTARAALDAAYSARNSAR